MALIPPMYFDCVVAVGFKKADASVEFQATGFLYGKLVSPAIAEQAAQYRVYLITNRHVFADQTLAVIRFNPIEDAAAKSYDLQLRDESNNPLWSVPGDNEVDIAVIPINVQLLRSQGIQFQYFRSDQNLLLRAKAQENGISEGNGVFVLGFPLGDVGGDRNYVIVRHGVIARIQDYLKGTKKHILIDATIFPGNSGSPVITKPEVVAITGTTSYSSSSLIGIVSAYVPYQDIAISLQTKRPRAMFEENTGIAVVFSTDAIAEAVERAFEKQDAAGQA